MEAKFATMNKVSRFLSTIKDIEDIYYNYYNYYKNKKIWLVFNELIYYKSGSGL